MEERSGTKLRTRQSVYADFSDPGYVWVYRTDNPDHESLHRNYSDGAEDWGRISAVDWWIASHFARACSAEVLDSVHARGSVIMMTGDLAARAAAEQERRAAGFWELFLPGSYAAVVPLLLHVYPAGVGTPPADGQHRGWLRLLGYSRFAAVRFPRVYSSLTTRSRSRAASCNAWSQVIGRPPMSAWMAFPKAAYWCSVTT